MTTKRTDIVPKLLILGFLVLATGPLLGQAPPVDGT